MTLPSGVVLVPCLPRSLVAALLLVLSDLGFLVQRVPPGSTRWTSAEVYEAVSVPNSPPPLLPTDLLVMQPLLNPVRVTLPVSGGLANPSRADLLPTLVDHLVWASLVHDKLLSVIVTMLMKSMSDSLLKSEWALVPNSPLTRLPRRAQLLLRRVSASVMLTDALVVSLLPPVQLLLLMELITGDLPRSPLRVPAVQLHPLRLLLSARSST